MKDKVFIAWSGTPHIAQKVKAILESEYNYICSVGGNEDNSSHLFTIGDTVMQQMISCNQAIVVFQKKESTDAVSYNLFFELGYVFARYGVKKVHVVRKETEELKFPSDFENAFVKPIPNQDDETFARGIVQYFLERQKMSLDENKMRLIDNRYMIHDLIQSHYSENGSKCSDYELAQYVLFYMQAAELFSDIDAVQKEIRKFREANFEKFSVELQQAVGICLSFFDMLDARQFCDGNIICIDRSTYRQYTESVQTILDGFEDNGVFREWAEVFIVEQRAYAHMLLAENPEISASIKEALYKKVIDDATAAVAAIARLEETPACREAHDKGGIFTMLRAYLYRNFFVAYQSLGDPQEALSWLKKSKQERALLKQNFARGVIDSNVYESFLMEYYLILVEYIQYAEQNHVELDPFEREMDLDEIGEYLQKLRLESDQNLYIRRISEYFADLKK